MLLIPYRLRDNPVLSQLLYLYSLSPPAISKALSSLPSLSHSLGEVMLQGVATSHMASAEDGKSKCTCMQF